MPLCGGNIGGVFLSHDIGILKKTAPYLFALLFIFGILPKSTSSESLSALICGIPVFSSEYFDSSNLSIDQIVEDENHVYILFGEHTGLVQVFDTKANYQYTIKFYEHLNGAFRIAAQNGLLYVRDMRGNVYIIQNAGCVQFIESENAAVLRKTIDFGSHSNHFELRFGSVWYVNENEEYCFLHRPLISVIYQDNMLFIFTIGMLFTFSIYTIFK